MAPKTKRPPQQDPPPSQNNNKKPKKAPTAFQNRVYVACKAIPAGRVSTYGAIAKALNSAPRAVGQALRCNSYAPIVPCHRVIAGDLEIGGFSGSWGATCPSVIKKKGMLENEGVKFSDKTGKLVDPRLVFQGTELEKAITAAEKSGKPLNE